MQQRSVSGRWAEFIQGVTASSVPPAVLDHAKVRLLDIIGTGLTACGLTVPELARAFVKGSQGPATIIGYPERMGVIDAALVNATLMNGSSLDDFLRKSHPGAVTIPSALAVAEETGRSGAEVLAGVIVGYEIVGRAFMGAPEMLPRFRASGVAGTVGAAATAARLYGLDVGKTMNALGAAACFAHGFGQGFVAGTTEVKLNVGMASRQGLSAAILARLGATASAIAFEGDVGYFRAFSGSIDHVDAATKGLGEQWLIEETVYKECPICVFTQTPVALAKTLASQVRVDEIERVTLTSPDLTYTNPGFLNDRPYKSHLQAAISAKFCTAAALLGKPVETYELYDQLEEPEVLALGDKIELVNRPQDKDRLDLEVVHKDGRRLTASGIEHDTLFPTKDKVIAKFRRLTQPLPIDTERVMQTILELDRVDDIRVLTDLLRTTK